MLGSDDIPYLVSTITAGSFALCRKDWFPTSIQLAPNCQKWTAFLPKSLKISDFIGKSIKLKKNKGNPSFWTPGGLRFLQNSSKSFKIFPWASSGSLLALKNLKKPRRPARGLSEISEISKPHRRWKNLIFMNFLIFSNQWSIWIISKHLI